MFGDQNKTQQMDSIPYKFIMVYDKFTKPAAYSLRNSFGKKYECAAWNENTYFANEPKFTNRNNIVLFNEKIIKEQLANPSINSIEYIPGIDLLREGNVVGLKYNSDTALKKLKDILVENWWQFLISTLGPIALVGGIPGAIIAYSLLLSSKKKKIKYATFFDAVNKLKNEGIEKYFNE